MAQRFLPICQLLGQLEERMRWVCDCGVSRGCLSPTNRAAVTTTTTSPSRRLVVLCSALGTLEMLSGSAFYHCQSSAGKISCSPPPTGRGYMVGLGVSPSPPAPQVTYIQTHTVAVPMRSLQFSAYGWPFVRHGVVAGCEVHFAASKPPGRGYLCFGHQSGLGRYLLSLGLMGTPWTPTKPSHSDLWISSF